MSVSNHEVYFILEDFEGDLWSLSRAHHVWIMSSGHNDKVVRRVWDQESADYSPQQGVTTFPSSDDCLAAFYSYLGTIDQHHDAYSAPGPWSVIHVRGLSLADVDEGRIASELDESVRVLPESSGFVILRQPN